MLPHPDNISSRLRPFPRDPEGPGGPVGERGGGGPAVVQGALARGLGQLRGRGLLEQGASAAPGLPHGPASPTTTPRNLLAGNSWQRSF